MSPSEVWIPVVFYWLPMLIFFYMGLDVLLRNPKKLEHILVSLTILCYFLLFLEEYIRHMLPIEYSPALAALWFANVGIAIPGLGFHLLAKLIGLDKRLPRPWYPYIFHVLLLAIPASIISRGELISAQEFVTVGVWKWPVANAAYYGTLTASLALSLISIVLLRIARKRNHRFAVKEHNGIFTLLEYGSIITFSWVVVFGYFQLGEFVPPYPYLYAGLIWCFVLRLAMQRYEFLNYNGHRYEKLFQMNPQPILLVASTGKIKEANPSARQLFYQVDLASATLHTLGGEALHNQLLQRLDVREQEMTLRNGDRSIEALVSGDYVTVNDEPHAILIVHDIGARNESLRQIAHMAYHDPLTDLPNRRQFYDKLNRAIEQVDDRELAVMVIDLDDFKRVNDRYGHEAGDLVLRRVADILREAVGEDGTAARIGGDEFVLFFIRARGCPEAEAVIERIEDAATGTVLEYAGERLQIRMSIGMSRYPVDGSTPDELLRHADHTMYGFKQGRKRDAAVPEEQEPA